MIFHDPDFTWLCSTPLEIRFEESLLGLCFRLAFPLKMKSRKMNTYVLLNQMNTQTAMQLKHARWMPRLSWHDAAAHLRRNYRSKLKQRTAYLTTPKTINNRLEEKDSRTQDRKTIEKRTWKQCPARECGIHCLQPTSLSFKPQQQNIHRREAHTSTIHSLKR